jgi:EKC/KEOPS complex subunit CGI121/TPRKB
MASVRSFTLPHYDAYPVHVALFTNVTNAAFLRSQLLAANPQFDYALLDASMILSPNHLLSATFLALHAFLTSRPKTRTPHSELVFRLSPNNNIGESYKKFGISDSTSTLIAVKLPLNQDGTPVPDGTLTAESVAAHLGSVVEGTSQSISERGDELGSACDLDKLRKIYKITTPNVKGRKGVAVDASNNTSELESIVLGVIALKGS